MKWPEIEVDLYKGNYIGVSKTNHTGIYLNDLFPLEGEDYGRWVHDLDNVEIEGSIQMYYDLWNFGDGDRFYKEMVDCLTEEKARRLRN